MCNLRNNFKVRITKEGHILSIKDKSKILGIIDNFYIDMYYDETEEGIFNQGMF